HTLVGYGQESVIEVAIGDEHPTPNRGHVKPDREKDRQVHRVEHAAQVLAPYDRIPNSAYQSTEAGGPRSPRPARPGRLAVTAADEALHTVARRAQQGRPHAVGQVQHGHPTVPPLELGPEPGDEGGLARPVDARERKVHAAATPEWAKPRGRPPVAVPRVV